MSEPIELPELAKPSGASNVRFLVIAVTSLMAVLLYLDRFCLAFAATFIKEDLGLSDVQISLLWSAFFVSYALAQVPSGWMTDRFGARRMLTLYILFWSLFTALTGLAFGFVTLFIFRIGIGLAQAGAYPTGANIVSKWIPFRNRGTASSVISVGGRIGGWMAVFLTGILIVLFVPTSVPSKLETKDILDAPRLCYEMVHVRSGSKAYEDAKSPEWKKLLAKRFVEKLAPATRQVVQPTADRYRNALTKARRKAVKEGELTDELDPDVAPLGNADLQLLVNDLNSIIADRELFKADELSELKLEKEADRLFARKRSELSDSEVDRLNRLVLEAMYRDSIRKVYGAGWRQVMWTYGFLGVLVAALFWWCLRNRPEEHPWANDAEAELIAEGRPRSAPQPHGRVRGVPLKRLLKSGSMWCICVSQWCTNVGWVFVFTLSPTFFEKVHQIPVEDRLWMASIPMIVGWIGMISGGFTTDFLAKKIGLRWGRALPMSLSRFSAMAAYIYCLTNPSPWAFVAAFSVVAFSTDLGTASSWAFKQDVGGKYVGSVLGWANMWGNLGAAFSVPLLIWIVNDKSAFLTHISSWFGETGGNNWNLAFLVCAIAFLIAGIACLGVNATKPIAPKDDEDDDDL